MISALAEEGVAKVEGLFTPGQMNDLRAAAFVVMRDVGQEERAYAAGGRMQWRDGGMSNESLSFGGFSYPALMFWPRLVNMAFEEVTTDAYLSNLIHDELGDDVRQLNNQLYFRLPGDEDAFDWHTDMAFRTGVRPGIETGYIQTMLCIDPMTEDNGCIWFVSGSHRLKSGFREGKPGRHSPGPLPDGMEARPMTAKSGDLLLWAAATVHGSFPNISDRPRMSYMNGFAKADFCDAWPWYLKGGELQPCDNSEIPYT